MLSFIHQILSFQLIEPLFWWFKKMPVKESFYNYRKLQYADYNSFKSSQNLKLHKILQHAIKNIPFYKNKYSNIHVDFNVENAYEDLKKFPIITKKNIKFCLEDFKCEMGRGTLKNSTGGSTGEPVIFYQDRVFKTESFAATMLFYEWANRTPGKKLVKLWGAERDLLKGGYGIKQKLIDFIGNRITINAFIMSPERINEYIKIINKKKPACVEGYAESLYELSNYALKNNIFLFSPKSVISSAGTLFPHMRNNIKNAFNTEVFDRYGSREAGNMAVECEKHDGLHVFGETTIIEVVDDEGNEVEAGQEGEILVTSLINYTMPLIRYQIGDRAIKGKTDCTCGRPYQKLEKIIGRSSSSFKTIEGGVVSPEFFIHLIGVMQNDGNIGKFQVIQENLEHLIVRLVPADDRVLDNWSGSREMIRLIRNVMGDNCRVDIRIEASIDLTSTGKHLYTISKI